MISMMYLVYTAMLAMNVSADILNAFQTVGESVEVTNKIMAGKAESAYIAFENAYNGNPGKVGENWARAQEIRKKTKEMVDYIDNMKYELIAISEQIEGGAAAAKKRFETEGFNMIKKKDNYNDPTRYFTGGSEDGSTGKAIELRKKIEAYQAEMLKYPQTETFKKQLKAMQIKTEGTWKDAAGKPKNWQLYNFYHTILTADLVLLNRFKSDIQNAEMDLINHLYQQISAEDFKFDQVTARVLPKSTYIIQGGQYEADVIVAAYDSKSELTGEVRGQNLVGDSGMLKLKFGANTLGEQKYKGTVYVKKETGSVPYEFEGEYFVAAPSVTVSPTNLQLFYIGIPNPISVSVPGASLKDITVTVSGAGATLDKVSDGQFTVTPKKQGERVKVHVKAKIAGKEMDMGVAEFRTKNIPAPEALIGKQKDGRIEKSVLKGIGGIRIDKGGFDFPVQYKVASYNILLLQNGEVVKEAAITGGKFTPDIMSAIDKLRRGAKVLINDIRAVGPTGTVTTANTSIILTIK